MIFKALLAVRLGKKRIVAETGAGNYSFIYYYFKYYNVNILLRTTWCCHGNSLCYVKVRMYCLYGRR